MACVRLYVLGVLLICHTCSANSPLIGQSFSIRTRITRDFDSRTELISENYSKSQDKAKLIHHAAKRGLDAGPTEYHYDASIGRGLLYSPATDNCTVIEPVYFYTSSLSFHGDLIKLMRMELPNSNPVIGPARLLMLVANRARELKDRSVAHIFGYETVQYTLEIKPPFEDANVVKLTVHYDGTTLDQAPLADQVPVFINCEDVWLHYFSLQLHHNEDWVSSRLLGGVPMDETSRSRDIIIDEYALPRTSKCIDSMPKYNIYMAYDSHSVKLSFEADTVDASGYLEHHWVQFDGLLQALRVDSHNGVANKMKSNIFNLRTNKRYMIWGGEQKECLLMDNLGRRRADLGLSYLLLGNASLALIGRATVRGIDSVVYAGLSDKLPYWFDQPILYSTGTSEELRRRGVTPNDDEPKRRDGSRYKLLIYMDSSRENRLLAMEVFKLSDHDGSGPQTLKVRFQNYGWHLSEASDGSRSTELFELVDSCSARAKDKHYLEVDLLLEQDEISSMADSSTGATWIQDWPARDSALLVALVDSLELDATMIHDLESRIREGHKLVTDVHFRLAEQRQLQYSIKLMGLAALKPAGNSLRDSSIAQWGSALLLADCLALASANLVATNPTYVYYSERQSACLIDQALNGASEQDLSKSSVFEITTKGGGSSGTDTTKAATGELYKVSSHYDHSINSASSQMILEKFDTLENRLLFLMGTTGQAVVPIELAVFKMRVKHAKLNSINYYLGAENSDRRSVFSTVAFLAGQSFYHRLLEQPDGADAGVEPIKFSQCEAACLADYRCTTFSYCVHFPRSECLLTEVLISGPAGEQLTRSIEQSAAGGGPPTTELIIQTEQHGEVRLRKDARCELHQKSYLSQFIKGYKEKNVLFRHKTLPVSGAEECAQSCFMRTLEVFKSLGGSLSHQDPAKNDHHLKNVCARFLYLNSILSSAQQQALAESIGGGPAAALDVGTHSGGFCVIRDDSDSAANASQSISFVFDYYDLDFTSLYERSFGFTLGETSYRPEVEALERLYHDSRPEDYETLERADREGRNVQFASAVSEQLCARKCLMQSTALWPACRSFDIIKAKSNGSAAPETVCILNTKLANQTERRPLDGSSSSPSSSSYAWHFEPRWDLIQRAIETNSIESERNFNSCKETSQRGLFRTTSILIGLVILAKVSGFLVGIRLTERMLRTRAQNSSAAVSAESDLPRHLYRENDDDIALANKDNHTGVTL